MLRSRIGDNAEQKSNFIPSEVLFDTKGRAIVFDIGNITLANLYLPFGSDALSKAERQEYFAATIPQLLLNRQDTGCIGGDFNYILNN